MVILQQWHRLLTAAIDRGLFVCVAVVEYKIGDMGFIRYYLAPKIEDGEDNS